MTRQPVSFVHTLCVAVLLTVAMPAHAESKSPPFVGTTRDQVVGRLGDPKSNLKAGTRELLFYPHLKLTLRNGIVVEAEEIADEPAPKRPPEPATAVSANATTSATGSAASTAPATASSPSAAPATPGNSEAANLPTAKPASDATATPAKPAPPPEPQLEIKSIRSGSSSVKTATRSATTAADAPATAITPLAKSAPVATAETKPPAALPPAATPAVTKAPAAATAPTDSKAAEEKSAPATTADADRAAPVEEVTAPETAPEKPVVDPKKKAAVRQRLRDLRDAGAADEPVQLFSTQSYVIAAITMFAGIGYLWWRRAQRNLELAATTVSHTPFEPAATAADPASHFTAEFVGKLGASRFERLVAAYYAKTGVVAERTNAGPDSPVHIKIFWKGEPRPFAGVQCHANPPALIGAKSLQDLFAALSAAEIRRGYVVTTGKFNVEARDYAEEKHFTLLSGDIFLEKLNALPPAARTELLKETNTDEPTPPAPGGVIT